MDSATSGNDSSERNIIGRRKSVDFLEARSPSGTNSGKIGHSFEISFGCFAEKAVLQFARNLNQRGLAIGSDVGQNLIVCDLDNTLIDVDLPAKRFCERLNSGHAPVIRKSCPSCVHRGRRGKAYRCYYLYRHS